MSQRVNIQYSIEIDELPEAVHELLKKSTDSLQLAVGPVHTVYLGDVLTLNTLDRIDELRLTMAKVDQTLEDVTSIIKGYLHHKSSPPAPLPQIENKEEITELQRQLADFETQPVGTENSEITDKEQ
jgi:hypothetical protein